jgi:hypothetical protein
MVWDFEAGPGSFELWSANGAGFAFDDPETAGDELLTGVGTNFPNGALPEAGSAWSVGTPDAMRD